MKEKRKRIPIHPLRAGLNRFWLTRKFSYETDDSLEKIKAHIEALAYQSLDEVNPLLITSYTATKQGGTDFVIKYKRRVNGRWITIAYVEGIMLAHHTDETHIQGSTGLGNSSYWLIALGIVSFLFVFNLQSLYAKPILLGLELLILALLALIIADRNELTKILADTIPLSERDFGHLKEKNYPPLDADDDPQEQFTQAAYE